MNIDLSLKPRKENTRTVNIPLVTYFTIEEIKKHFDENIAMTESQFALVDHLYEEGDSESGKTVLRSQIMLLESSLDFYLHELTKYAMCKMLGGKWDKTDKYDHFMIPMSQVERLLISMNEKNDWFWNYISCFYEKSVMLSPDEIKDQLNLVGIKFDEVMIKTFPCHDNKIKDKQNYSLDQGKRFFGALFGRRNAIAHQMDRSHTDAEQADITKEYVSKQISTVKNFVEVVHSMAIKKNI